MWDMGRTIRDVQALVARDGRWIALMAIPLVVNSVAWVTLVVPQRRELEVWRETQTVTELKPKLESLLAESHQMVTDWRRTAFTNDDPSAVMQAIQRLAGQHHVQIKELSASQAAVGHTAPLGSTSSVMPLELEVTGRFSQLAHWISDVEAQAGLQIDSWKLSSEEGADQFRRLTIKMSAFLQGASST